jgi:serine/threonine-protein kinase
VSITVSAGVEQVAVPKVSGRPVTEAIQVLSDAGLDSQVREVFSEREPGIVVGQNPKADTQVAKGSTVVLRVSKGVQTVTVPDVLFQSQADAQAELEAAGLGASVVEVESDEAQGLVVGQDPDPGAEVDVGATVTISVSLGPPPVLAVPSVLDLDQASAEATLAEAGFEVEVIESPTLDASRDGLVSEQDPPAGSEVEPGTTVTIVVERLPF